MLTHTSVHEDFFGGPGASLDLTSQDYTKTSQNGRDKKMGAGSLVLASPWGSQVWLCMRVFSRAGALAPLTRGFAVSSLADKALTVQACSEPLAQSLSQLGPATVSQPFTGEKTVVPGS